MDIRPDQRSSSPLRGLGKLLNGGSLDLLIHIQNFLDPADIISLRLTSKALSDATRPRTVWMNALRHVCSFEGAFIPSFPLKEMSLDDLEHVALSPHRFAEHLRKNNGNRITPFQTRVLEPKEVFGIPSNMKGFFLVPGGRFLVTLSFGDGLCLWDLGVTASSPMKPFPMAELYVEAAQLTCIGPTHDSAGIYAFISDVRGDDTHIEFYEIYPNSDTPQFRRVGGVAVSGNLTGPLSLSTDFIALHHSTAGNRSQLTIWKYSQNMGATWAIDSRLCSIYILDENIITFHDRKFVLWTIPALHTLLGDIFSKPPLVEHDPQLPLAYPYANRSQDQSIVVPSPWLPKGAISHLVFLNTDRNTGSAMSHYTIRPIVTSGLSGIPALLPLPVGVMQTFSSGLNEISCLLDFLHISDERFIQSWVERDSGDVVVDLISLPSQNRPTYSAVSATLWSQEASQIDVMNHNFCPITGRLVAKMYTTLDVDRDNPEIRVMDFLVPRSFL